MQIAPANGAQNVPVTTNVTFTFNEPIDVTTLAAGLRVTVGALNSDIAGTLSVNANVVTFTPLALLPGSRAISVTVNNVMDLGGNSTGFAVNFTTWAAGDVTAPQSLSVSPSDQSVDVPSGAPIVLIFSESLDPAFASANLRLFVNGNVVVPTFLNSPDNRMFTLTAGLPAGSIVSVIATGGLRDLSGNRFTDFVSAFTTAANGDGAGRRSPRRFRLGRDRGASRFEHRAVCERAARADTVGPALHAAQKARRPRAR